jgi:hypothetical protein
MKVASLAGEPLVVDELSLIKTSPVRVNLNCRDPSKLTGFVKIFFNKVGYKIRFISEKLKEKPDKPPPSPHIEMMITMMRGMTKKRSLRRRRTGNTKRQVINSWQEKHC